MSEISKIKPPDNKQREKPNFTYDDSAYRSYIKEGFEVPAHAPDRKEKEFLSQVDLSKGKIKVRVTHVIRQLAIDYSSERQEKKEYLTWISDWFAKNWMEADINPIRGHIEGFHFRQTKQLQLGDINPKTGVQSSYYVKGNQIPVFTLPFSPRKVDEILNGPTPFGSDSENITNQDNVLYYGKIDIPGLPAFRCNDYTHDQFVTPKWSDFMEMAIRQGGPANRKTMTDKTRYIA